ncbi:GFA family protein [Pelagibius sp.]|uniref:GFA family protein n=1 Tax=Pelagibius sp. TaxID=1931238 RepID=UPI0026372A5A|nr:GFA family protein [Pelagibius sp.]
MAAADDFVLDGGCVCGAVRYRMTARPLFVHCCHCRWCQRETGSAFVLNALIESEQVELLKGRVEAVSVPSESGRSQEICRCPTCQVALWSHYSGAGKAIRFIRAGTLDDPKQVPPDVHIYTDSKQPWVILPDGVPAFAEYYRARETWPAESLARARAAKERAQSL